MSFKKNKMEVIIPTSKLIDTEKANLNNFLNKEIQVSVLEGSQKNNLKTINYMGELVSISSNIFSIKILIKENFVIKSFSIMDLLIKKISIKSL